MAPRHPAVVCQQQQGEALPMGKNKGATGVERKSRRALKDIGNMVNVVAAEGKVQPQVNRRITRSFCAQLLANEKAAIPDATTAYMLKPIAICVDGATEMVGNRAAKKLTDKHKVEDVIDINSEIEEEIKKKLVDGAAERVGNRAKKVTNTRKVEEVNDTSPEVEEGRQKQSVDGAAERVGNRATKKTTNKRKVEEVSDINTKIEEEREKLSMHRATESVGNRASKKVTKKRKVEKVIYRNSKIEEERQSVDVVKRVGNQAAKKATNKRKVEEVDDMSSEIENEQQKQSVDESAKRVGNRAAKKAMNKCKVKEVGDINTEIKEEQQKLSVDGAAESVGNRVAKRVTNKCKVEEVIYRNSETEEERLKQSVDAAERVGIQAAKKARNKRKVEEVNDVSSEIETQLQKQSVDGAAESVGNRVAKRVTNKCKVEEVIYRNSETEEERLKQSVDATERVGIQAAKKVRNKRKVEEVDDVSFEIETQPQKQSVDGAAKKVGNRAAKKVMNKHKVEELIGISSEIKEEQQRQPVGSSTASCSKTLKKRAHTLTSASTARKKAACEATAKPKELVHDIDTADGKDQLAVVENSCDAADVEDQLEVVEHVEDIYMFYKVAEQSCQPHDYINSQVEINEKMRAILVNWLIEVHHKFRLMPETLFLTFYIIDHYLSMAMVLRRELQLVGLSAMLIASKYEDALALEVNDLICVAGRAYTREQILGMEKRILNKLGWNLTVPTPNPFLMRFLKAALRDKEMENMVFFFAELGSMQYSTILYCPSIFAASAVYAARCTLKKRPYWTKTLKHQTGFSEDQLSDCTQILVNSHSLAPESKLKVVYQKYSSKQFGAVALRPPATKVLEKLKASKM